MLPCGKGCAPSRRETSASFQQRGFPGFYDSGNIVHVLLAGTLSITTSVHFYGPAMCYFPVGALYSFFRLLCVLSVNRFQLSLLKSDSHKSHNSAFLIHFNVYSVTAVLYNSRYPNGKIIALETDTSLRLMYILEFWFQ